MFQKIRVLLAIIKAIKDPRETESIGKAVDGGNATAVENFKCALEKLSQDPNTWEKIQKREPVSLLDLEALRRFAPGTLGHAVWKHMDDNGLQPNLLPVEVKDTGTYVRSRYRKTHDIWHVVTGYSTSIADELALQAFTLAQINGPGSGLVLGIGMFHYVFFKPAQLPAVFEAMVEGYIRGQRAVPLLGVDWQSLWDKPLVEVKRQLRTEPLTASRNQVNATVDMPV